LLVLLEVVEAFDHGALSAEVLGELEGSGRVQRVALHQLLSHCVRRKRLQLVDARVAEQVLVRDELPLLIQLQALGEGLSILSFHRSRVLVVLE